MKIIESTQQHRLDKAILGAHPIIQHYLDKLQLQDLFRTYVKSDKRLAIPLEEGMGVLLHNLLTESMPFYQMTEWLEPLDMDRLGLGAYAPTAFNDVKIEALRQKNGYSRKAKGNGFQSDALAGLAVKIVAQRSDIEDVIEKEEDFRKKAADLYRVFYAARQECLV